MYKRPTLRLRDPSTTPFIRPVEGTFLHSITKNEKTKYFEPPETYIANYDNYIETLRKSCEKSGAKFKVPKYILPMPEIEPVPQKNKSLIGFVDDVIVRVNVLKCGKVRVKLITHMATLYEKYFSKNKIPPSKTLAAALKAIGYDERYVSSVPDIIENRRKSMDIRWKTLDDMFNKPSASNSKKKAKKEPEPEPDVEIEHEEDDEDEEEDDSAPAEEAIGNDEVEDDEEVVEEEYFSDGE